MVKNSSKAISIDYRTDSLLCGFPLCPLAAVATMVIRFTPLSSCPMFAIPQGPGVIPLTQSKVRKFLALLLITLITSLPLISTPPLTPSIVLEGQRPSWPSTPLLAYNPSNNMVPGL